jgi:hypothetical protein
VDLIHTDARGRMWIKRVSGSPRLLHSADSLPQKSRWYCCCKLLLPARVFFPVAWESPSSNVTLTIIVRDVFLWTPDQPRAFAAISFHSFRTSLALPQQKTHWIHRLTFDTFDGSIHCKKHHKNSAFDIDPCCILAIWVILLKSNRRRHPCIQRLLPFPTVARDKKRSGKQSWKHSTGSCRQSPWNLAWWVLSGDSWCILFLCDEKNHVMHECRHSCIQRWRPSTRWLVINGSNCLKNSTGSCRHRRRTWPWIVLYIDLPVVWPC